MDIKQHLFSWKGEMSRLPYFLTSLALSFGVSIACFAIVAVALVTMGGEGKDLEQMFYALMLSLVLVAPLVLVSLYCQIVIMIKRLHDIGWSGKNVFWIYGLTFAAQIFLSFESGIGLMIGLVLSIGVLVTYLWLLFMPGQSPNYHKDVFE